MTSRLGYGQIGKPNLDELADANLRKSMFQQMSRRLVQAIREGIITDRPESIARLMEQSFMAGVEVARADAKYVVRDRLKRKLTEKDVPQDVREVLNRFRFALSRNRHLPLEEPLRAEALAFILRPHLPGFSSVNDEWMLADFRRETFHNRVIEPLKELELVECKEFESGWSIGVFNEWGFELLMTGKTRFPEDRSPRCSTTESRYRKLLDEKPVTKAAIALGFIVEDHVGSPIPKP